MNNTTEIFQVVVAAVSVLIAISTIIGALRAGVLRRIRFGSFEIEATAEERQQAHALVQQIQKATKEDIPFETEQLAQYYAQILAQSKISFWFSLIFASLGFVVIIVAGFLHKAGDLQATSIQIFAGVVMDTVSALFFVQSRNAQKSMGEFFDKLRRDRQQMESRKLCDSITNEVARDALKMHLALHYAELNNHDAIAKSILENCLATNGKVTTK